MFINRAGRFFITFIFVSLLYIITGNDVYAQTAADSTAQTAQSGGIQETPLRSPTAFETYIVELDWEPSTPRIENETTFTVRFFDSSGNVLTRAISYDFTAASSDLTLIAEFYNQSTDAAGVGRPLTVRFENPGPAELTVWANPEPGSDLQSESATFNMLVAPEFSLALPILVASITIAAITIVSRTGKRLDAG